MSDAISGLMNTTPEGIREWEEARAAGRTLVFGKLRACVSLPSFIFFSPTTNQVWWRAHDDARAKAWLREMN